MRSKKQRELDRARAKNNASEYHWKQMTAAEKEWLIAFETSEYEAERGHVAAAVDALLEVGIIPSDKYVQDMRGRRDEKSNPERINSTILRGRKRDGYQGIRAPKSNMYDASDYVRVMPGNVNKDDLGFEAAYSKEEITEVLECDDGYVEYAKIQRTIKVEAGLNPDETAVMVNPEDGIIEAIDQAKSKGRSLEKLVEDAKLSKEAKEVLKEKAQTFSYNATVYTFHGRQYMNLNYVLVAQDGTEWVQDQHGRLARLALYLKRETSDSFATHSEIYYPGQSAQIWIFEAAKRSNIEGTAKRWE